MTDPWSSSAIRVGELPSYLRDAFDVDGDGSVTFADLRLALKAAHKNTRESVRPKKLDELAKSTKHGVKLLDAVMAAERARERTKRNKNENETETKTKPKTKPKHKRKRKRNENKTKHKRNTNETQTKHKRNEKRSEAKRSEAKRSETKRSETKRLGVLPWSSRVAAKSRVARLQERSPLRNTGFKRSCDRHPLQLATLRSCYIRPRSSTGSRSSSSTTRTRSR